jgi:tetratricopeptide (TPR) repeat protein
MRQKRWIALLGCLLIAATAMGATKIVYRRGAPPLIGTVTRTDDGDYRIRTRIGEVTVEAEDVLSIKDYVSFEDQYKKRLAKIDPKDPVDRYKIASWAFDEGKLDVALEEINKALKLDSDYEDAQVLKALIERQRGRGGDDENGEGRVADVPGGGRYLLPMEDVYRIRLLELRRNTDLDGQLELRERVGLRFRDDVITRFITAMEGKDRFRRKNADRAFRRAPRTAQLAYMLQVLSDKSPLFEDILVTQDPEFMREFQRHVMPIVRNLYADALSSNTPEKGKLFLISYRGRNTRVDYTNFVLLDAFAIGSQRMIDRNNPKMSLLLQHGLPEDLAEIKNPRENYTPVYRSLRDPLYQRVHQWIRSLRAPHPDYALSYKPPKGVTWKMPGSGTGLPPRASDDDEESSDDDKPSSGDGPDRPVRPEGGGND